MTIRIAFMALTFLVFLAIFVRGQNPTPSPAVDDVVRISTNLIRVDVAITDRGGKPIRDIRRNEIEIYENGQKQEVAGFSFVSSGGQGVTAEPVDTRGKKIGVASQFVHVPDLADDRLTLSSIVLEDMSVDDYQRSGAFGSGIVTDPMNDTAQRKIRVGRVYRYSFDVYNAKLDSSKQPGLETRIRVFCEGKLILDGKPKPFVQTGSPGLANLSTIGGLSIGAQMEPGDYVLQIIVKDAFAKKDQQFATQFVQFEVVN